MVTKTRRSITGTHKQVNLQRQRVVYERPSERNLTNTRILCPAKD